MRLAVALFALLTPMAGFTATGKVIAEEVINGQGVIWGFDFLSEQEILMTERDGAFKRVHLVTKKITPVKSDLKVYNHGQGGLLDIVLHPDFEKNNWVYFTYSCEKDAGNTTCLGRAKLKGNELVQREELFAAEPFISSRQHFGSRLHWDKDGCLFMTTGDRYIERDRAQALDNHLGKILRLTEDGKPAPGNPFSGRKDAKPEIWSYGHRNLQGLDLDERTGLLWAQEHGAQGGDEINQIFPGKNYGWPVITHGRDYSGAKIGIGTAKPGMEQPFYHFTPSIAPSGLLVYSGRKYPQWQGHLFSGALALRHLNHLVVENGKVIREDRHFLEEGARVRNVKESPAGEIYFSTDSGRILRVKLLEPAKK